MKAPEPAVEVYVERLDEDAQRLEQGARRAVRHGLLAIYLLFALVGFVAGAAAMLFLLSLGD